MQRINNLLQTSVKKKNTEIVPRREPRPCTQYVHRLGLVKFWLCRILTEKRFSFLNTKILWLHLEFIERTCTLNVSRLLICTPRHLALSQLSILFPFKDSSFPSEHLEFVFLLCLACGCFYTKNHIRGGRLPRGLQLYFL